MKWLKCVIIHVIESRMIAVKRGCCVDAHITYYNLYDEEEISYREQQERPVTHWSISTAWIGLLHLLLFSLKILAGDATQG